MVQITRNVNYITLIDTDINKYYTHYIDAINAANDEDIINIYQDITGNTNPSDNLFISFTYKKSVEPEPINKLDELGKFLYTFLASTNPKITNLQSKQIYLNYENNIFKLGLLKTVNDFILASNTFIGSKITLSTIPTNTGSSQYQILIGIADNLVFNNKDVNAGMFIKVINTINFNSSDSIGPQNLIVNNNVYDLNINLEMILSDRSADLTKIEFYNKLYNLINTHTFNKINIPNNYILSKLREKTYVIVLPSDNILLLIDPGRYIEYSINQLSFNRDQNIISYNDEYSQNNIINRSCAELCNKGQTIKKGIFNGWKLNKINSNFISYNLYDKIYDFDISKQQLQYFWIVITSPNLTTQSINIKINGNTYTKTIDIILGTNIYWYSPNTFTPPSSSQFNFYVTPISFNKINFTSSILYVNSININTIDNTTQNDFFIESYGYSVPSTFYSFALTRKNNSAYSNQICLDNQANWNLLINKIIEYDSNLPMEPPNDISIISNGWYFNSDIDYKIKLLDYSNIIYSDLYTLFIEVLINSSTISFYVNAFGKSIPITSDIPQRKVIYFKSSPLELETYISAPDNYSMTAKISTTILNDVYCQDIEPGTYFYTITYVTMNDGISGETTGNITSDGNKVLTNIHIGIGKGRVELTQFPTLPNSFVIGINIYRAQLDSSGSLGKFLLLDTLFGNLPVGFIYYDIKGNNFLGKEIPSINTTNNNTYNPYSSTYFTYLNQTKLDIKSIDTNLSITGNTKLGDLLINIGNNTNIEIISYGYKVYGLPPVHFMTRWSSIENNTMIYNIDKFLIIQKDFINMTEPSSQIAPDAKFKVKAYGDFISGKYFWNTLTKQYNDIVVNVNVNKYAIKNAFYFLDSADMSNYTIKIDNLSQKNTPYITDSVAIVDNLGNPVKFINSANYRCQTLNGKYIIPNFNFDEFGNIIPNYTSSSYLVKPIIFNKNGGIQPVLLQSVHAALFKEFNKSGSILNNSIFNSFNQDIPEIVKPDSPYVSYSTSLSSNLIDGAYYSYRITYFTKNGETEASIESNSIIANNYKIQVIIKTSTDISVIGCKIYRRILNKNSNNFIFIDSIKYIYAIQSFNITLTDDYNIDSLAKIQQPLYINIGPITTVISNNGNLNGTYTYAYSYFVINTNDTIFETNISELTVINCTSAQIQLTIPISHEFSNYINNNNNNSYGIYIYRQDNSLSQLKLLHTYNIDTNSNIPMNIIYTDNTLNNQNTQIPGQNTNFITSIRLLKNIIGYLTSIAYTYAYSYFVISNSVNLETNISLLSDVTINNPSSVILNIPISREFSNYINNNYYNITKYGRYIYRVIGTKDEIIDSSKLKLLDTIFDNSTTIYIDNISDDMFNNNGKSPVIQSTLSSITAPSLTYLHNPIIYTEELSENNLLPNCTYLYKFTYSTGYSVDSGETLPSDVTNSVTQLDVPFKILINIPISPDPNVNIRNIYRSNNINGPFKFLTSIPDNLTTIFIDDINDDYLGISIPDIPVYTITWNAPEINTTAPSSDILSNTNSIYNLIESNIKEFNRPVADSESFKLYVNSDRYAQDLSISSSSNIIDMQLENMEINIKCKLRGLLYQNTNSGISKVLTKNIAETIFGTYHKTTIYGEPDTLVKMVTRDGNNIYGYDEFHNKFDMLNNIKDVNGNYISKNEIQYSIDFVISLVQKSKF